MEEKLNSNFLEKIMLKAMLVDKNFLILLSSVFEENYFDDSNIASSFKFCKNYVDEYNSIPSKEAIINSSDTPNDIKEIIDEAEGIEFNIADSYEFLLNQSNDYLKEKALKCAIRDSIDDVEDPEKRNIIQKRIEDALVRDLKIDLGLRYFEDLGVRLRRIFTESEKRIPTYFPVFDEIINGGFPALTFSCITAKIHGGKSLYLGNCAARQVLQGHNVVLLTLEMSQDAFAQRFDSIYSGLDINKIYLSRRYKRNLMGRLKNIKDTENRGELFIKQYPTGSASVLDFRIYLRELILRGIDISIVYVDYINLMKAAYRVDNNMYSAVKRISEELRALSFEFKCPFVSVSQLNREGFFVNFDELNFNYIAESIGIASTSDFVAIMGTDEDKMVYESEILYKIVKSRIGGRVGIVDKFYIDKRSLKMFDSSELDIWIAEADISGDDRSQLTHENNTNNNNRRRNN